MALSHYMSVKAEATVLLPGYWAEFMADVRKILNEARRQGLELRGPEGYGLPQIDEDGVCFAGKIPHTHHDFLLFRELGPVREPHDEHFTFWKTHKHPYEIAILAVLLRLASHDSNVEIRTDYSRDNPQVEKAFELYEKALRAIAPRATLKCQEDRD